MEYKGKTYNQQEFERMFNLIQDASDELSLAQRKFGKLQKMYSPIIQRMVDHGYDLFGLVDKRWATKKESCVEYNCEEGIHNWRLLWDDYRSSCRECLICNKSEVKEY